MQSFDRYIGIDYSGAETPTSSLKGLRVYQAYGDALPEEVLPPPSPRKYWTRRGIAQWLLETLSQDIPSLVGIDHGFSFPLRYFEVHHLLPDWPSFLDDFQNHWPTDGDHVYVDFVRDGSVGSGEARTGDPRWRRLCEERCRAKSVFHFDVQGSVAKSTHAGLSTDGKFRPADPQSSKPILLFIKNSSPLKIALPINTTHTVLRPGCDKLIMTTN